jgi:FlaA1/EpsC-like NDP-sugar epimerase
VTQLPAPDPISFRRLSDLILGETQTPEAAEMAMKACKRSVVMVTGAGGSIGSALCQRIAKYDPHTVIMFDISEAALYQAHRAVGFHPDFIPLMGDIRSRDKLRAVMQQYKPSLVIHAAALKHVHMLEHPMNLKEAVSTNIMGTYEVCFASLIHQARMVMISTDKAVNPTSILGLTKRVAETVVEHFSHKSGKFSVVRFGNVMNSSGSAIPLFKEQIAKGGPVTITDMNMSRFMMTLTQAVELVLASATLPAGMHILDMGDDIKIVDLARMLIRMADKEPGRDIDIVEVGMRPGEKLHEELMYLDELTGVTKNNGIFSVPFGPVKSLDIGSFEGTYESVMYAMKAVCPEYQGDHA